jgi:hypothetical protein
MRWSKRPSSWTFVYRLLLPATITLLIGCAQLAPSVAKEPLGMVEALQLVLPIAMQQHILQVERYEVTIRKSARGGWVVNFVLQPAHPEGVLAWEVAPDRRITKVL